MKIALVHDYLNEAGGAERVLKVLAQMYPAAPIYTAFAKRNGSAYITLQECDIRESKWAWLLKIGRFYSYFRFLLPWIWRSVDLSEYDLVITSTSGGYIARGFRVRDDARVVAYCHTPPKWLYGYQTPTGAMGKWWGKAFLWVFGPPLRYFDYLSAQRVDSWIANSKEVAGRIWKFYRKQAVVVYPPIEIGDKSSDHSPRIAPACAGRQGLELGYYLLVTRVTGAKGVREAAEAARSAGFRLKLVGEMVEKRELGIEDNENVEYLGRVSDERLGKLYAEADGFVALARDEDFGMTVVEAMAHGTPVLAYNGGGYRETVIPGKTGIFVNGTDIKSVREGLKQMEKIKWNRGRIKKWASRFGRDRFEREIREIVGAKKVPNS